jgi:glucose-1-phosphate adenylyltransferase
MDYNEMLEYHIEKDADCTIATLTVPMEDASRFGIMNTDKNMVITEFEEKPKQPKNDQASMGIYLFKKDKLREYLIKDELTEGSSNDFGKNIIPNMLNDGCRMVAYPFKGYWKDVGTIDSLWSANMDLIGNDPKFDIYDPAWKIYSRNVGIQPQYVGENAKIENSLISGGTEVEGTVINSVIGSTVKIGKGAIVKDSVIFSNVEIGDNAVINYSIIDENVKIGAEAVIGDEKADDAKIAVIGRGCNILASKRVAGGSNLEAGKEDQE